MQKNLKPILYGCAVLMVLVAVFFSKSAPKTPAEQAASRHQPPQPALQDSTDNNVQDLKDMTAAKDRRWRNRAGVRLTPHWRM